MVPEDKNRLPLGEFSSSKINRLMTCKMYDKPAKTLPSIRSLIHLSPYEKRPRHPTTTNHTPHQQSPRIKEIDSDTDSDIDTNYNDLSNKLRVRLQFAYYKYKTNQTDQRFKDIRKHTQRRQVGNMHNKRPKLPKRKLMVSHGNFKTPAKASHLLGTQERDSPASTSASIGERLRFCEAPQDAATITTTMTTTTTITTATPIGKVGKKFLQQETPMSVRAAKSLIHLFTSNQH
ncbi:ZYRO0C05456p [Zygosaccharomyces rouxii]|uniref:ZYRO0C05456p n=1 Tax=Zygosaccharomyces rouxii (strain ATCC 2623 / CBS 732 / NBRC 1130 / NCYC 568 / NRRL Y-229) TaxID=559307 RepID=C5DT48_ZYGRC|nr:uncharacterized protein ZYRO0C05456g [Zygosaccharomyces rouxii]KAH9201855.1 hypothetical protein LQ764DRAFT_89034 [Zygosaccharomyces rouxii]CAR26959.1 ZYRO0C05456p [Zygosaccharomyces rouxii]